jgi:hypothetical protein
MKKIIQTIISTTNDLNQITTMKTIRLCPMVTKTIIIQKREY